MTSLPEHDHCKNCGDPVPFDMQYCCMECYNEYQEKQKKEKRKDIMFWAAAALSVVVIVVVAVLLK